MSVIGILHGYLLEGSGSNLWTQSVLRAICRAGRTVHVMCQEPHPDRIDFVAQMIRYDEEGRPRTLFTRSVKYPGRCILHKPTIGPVLPVFVEDRYEEHDRVERMVDLSDDAIEEYVRRNVEALDRIVIDHGVTRLLANHAVLMPSVARRVATARSIPFAIMPHGSGIEYAVKKDARLHGMAAEAFQEARSIFVIGPEIRRRVGEVFRAVPGIRRKMTKLPLGVDTELFAPVEPDARPGSIVRMQSALRELQKRTAPDSGKQPDPDCEPRLLSVNWRRDRILIFVGRLIAGKGVQSILAAMPAILQREPRARLIVVGHGPLRSRLEDLLRALEEGDLARIEGIVAGEGAAGSEPLVHEQRYFERLARQGKLEPYLRAARESKVSRRVIFTGYLTHRELKYLLPCCDVAVFPSVVPEAGPLVFLEAMASGVFPLGTDLGGTAASIDALAGRIPRRALTLMKIRSDPRYAVADIVTKVSGAFRLGRRHAAALRRAAIERHDWAAVGRTLLRSIERPD